MQRWMFWMMTALILSVGTFYLAFGTKFKQRLEIFAKKSR